LFLFSYYFFCFQSFTCVYVKSLFNKAEEGEQVPRDNKQRKKEIEKEKEDEFIASSSLLLLLFLHARISNKFSSVSCDITSNHPVFSRLTLITIYSSNMS